MRWSRSLGCYPDHLDEIAGDASSRDRWRLRAQIQDAVKFQIGADIAHGVVTLDRLANGGVNDRHALDQRLMGARQGTGRQLGLNQPAQGRQFLDPLDRQLGRGDPSR